MIKPTLEHEKKPFDWQSLPLKNIIRLSFLGFSAGLPILLIFSTLSLWLREAGVAKSAVTYFSWAALGYSFKFVWAPIVDKLPLPFLTSVLGRRRGWLLLSQMAVIAAIIWMASVDPITGLTAMAFGAVALGFSSATQDIVIDAYRIECAQASDQALLSSSYIGGYRIGMVVAGAGGLYLADFFGSSKEFYSYLAWQKTYCVMAAVMLLGVLTTLLIPEPKSQQSQAEQYQQSTQTYIRFFALFLFSVIGLVIVYRIFPSIEINSDNALAPVFKFLMGTVHIFTAIAAGIFVGFLGAYVGLVDKKMVIENYLSPIQDFFARYGRIALWVLLLVGFYRVSDIVLGVIANVFYQDLGYTKTEIASVSKVFGLLMTIAGSFAGGFLALRFGVMRILLLGAILSAGTNLIFMWLAGAEATMQALTLVIAVDNLSAGLAMAAFIAWLSSLTSISFTATQYAIFSSLMTLFPKVLGGYSGSLVDSIGYNQFFLFTALIGLPVIALIIYLNKKL